MTTQYGAQKKNWWNRNWYWAVPGGCLGCLGLTLGSCALLVGGLLGAVRDSSGYQEALARVQAHPEVVAALGEPIEAGWVFQGNVNISDSTKTVDVRVPISGPDGSAMMHLKGSETGGSWNFERLEVELSDGARIDLLGDPGPADRDRLSSRHNSPAHPARSTY